MEGRTMPVLTDGITGLSCHERSHMPSRDEVEACTSAVSGKVDRVCAPTFGVAQAATHMMNAVDERSSEMHARGWYECHIAEQSGCATIEDRDRALLCHRDAHDRGRALSWLRTWVWIAARDSRDGT